jgi:hypothetical protein
VILGVPARISPVEEMIWSKAFVMERERYDGADVAHLLLAKAPELDWSRLLDRFGPNQLVLLSHIVLFLYIYPSEKEHVPAWIWKKLLSALEREREQPSEAGRVCRGALLSRGQFLNDLEQGFRDPRLIPEGTMSASDVTIWTDAAKQREEAV